MLPDKEYFYYSNGTPFLGLFREIDMTAGSYYKDRKEAASKGPIYTINEEDDDLPSAHKIYMESVSEYDAALKMVPSWSFWKDMLERSNKIRRVVENWREEKLLRDQDAAKKMLWQQAEKGNLTAQKLLFEAKKEERELRRQAIDEQHRNKKAQEVLTDRFDRISNLKVIK